MECKETKRSNTSFRFLKFKKVFLNKFVRNTDCMSASAEAK